MSENPHVRLATLAASLRSGTPDADNCARLAEILERIVAGGDAGTALGIKRGPGQRTWDRIEALAERDRLLRHAATRFIGGLSVAAQANVLHRELMRYHASAWQRDRTCDECPAHYVRTLHEMLWLVLKLHDSVLAERSIRAILARS